jgi:hypothetical protein
VNRVPRRISGPKRDEVIVDWRTLHCEELHNLYSSQSIITKINSRRMRWAWYVACMGQRGKRIRFWWESHKKPLERSIHRWEDNIKINLRDIR